MEHSQDCMCHLCLPGDQPERQSKPDAPVELEGCIAYPTGEGCPLDWCRRSRGDWCKDWRTGRICKNKRI